MKTLKLLFVGIFFSFLLSSCTADYYENNYNNSISLPQLIEQYDLWYVDYDNTTGNGDIPFLSRAFTISFINGTMYANNNLVGIGTTGNGIGIPVGYYNYSTNSILASHNLYGFYELEVQQLSSNRIAVYNYYENTTCYLIGYQTHTFDYDRVFYDNIHYFLQEYVAWEKVYTSTQGNPNVFDYENYLQFLAGGNDDTFRSSQDYAVSNVNNIAWDFSGNYSVQNVAGNYYEKKLRLFYDTNDYEEFIVNIINDGRIRLYHISSGTTYEFQGRGYIQYLRENTKRTKSNIKAHI